MDNLMVVGLIGCGLLGVLIVLCVKLLLQRIKEHKHALAKKDDVRAIFEECISGRSRMDIKFVRGDMAGRYMRGPCMAVAPNRVLVDTGLRYGIQGWIGQEVHVYFQLSHEKVIRYYDFFAEVQNLHRYEGGFALELSFPPYLNNNQKRTFVRLTPSWRLVRELNLWASLSAHNLNAKPEDLPLPTLSESSLTLDNISGGGIRLLVSKADKPVSFTVEQGLCIFARLQGPDYKSVLPLWLIASIVSISEVTPDLQALSLRFRAWAPDPAQDVALSWFPVDSEGGVPPLAAWVMLRHLEISHERVPGEEVC